MQGTHTKTSFEVLLKNQSKDYINCTSVHVEAFKYMPLGYCDSEFFLLAIKLLL
jgi:hypothetical protein